jgi:acyl-CoA synthetase (AMP-forming)/AMP-acid ligase II
VSTPVPLDLLLERDGTALALVLDERSYATADLVRRVHALRRAFASLALPPGSVVSWIGLTSVEAVTCELAVTSLGLIWAPLGARLTARELTERFQRLAPRVVLHDAVEGGRSQIAERTAEALDAYGFDGLDVGIGAPGRGLSFDALLDIGRALTRDPAIVRDASINRIQFTSGTESVPKAVALSSVALMANARTMAAAMRLGHDDRFFNPLPLDHAAGYCTLLTMLGAGGASVMQPYFEAAEALELMRAHRCTAFRGVDAVYLDLARLAGDDPPRVRTGVLSTTNASVRRRVEAAFGFEDGIQLYGMTESSGPAVISRAGEPVDLRLGTHGAPVEGMEVRISEPDERGVGEIQLRGERMMVGYLGDPAATAKACAGGWFSTGDLGQFSEGRLRYLGRTKELIKVGGENVSCAEIEAVLIDCPGVEQVAAFPVPDERLGEVVGAAVVGADLERVRAHAEAHLARFKRPRELVLVDELPRTSAGKVRRRDLAQLVERSDAARTAAPFGSD